VDVSLNHVFIDKIADVAGAIRIFADKVAVFGIAFIEEGIVKKILLKKNVLIGACCTDPVCCAGETFADPAKSAKACEAGNQDRKQHDCKERKINHQR